MENQTTERQHEKNGNSGKIILKGAAKLENKFPLQRNGFENNTLVGNIFKWGN